MGSLTKESMDSGTVLPPTRCKDRRWVTGMDQSKGQGPGVSADDIPRLNVSGDIPPGEPVLFGRQAECEILDGLVAGA
jgi:hypothetical protein